MALVEKDTATAENVLFSAHNIQSTTIFFDLHHMKSKRLNFQL